MPRDYIPVENKICEKSLGFHIANGKIHDTKGNKEKKTTSWRAVCEPNPAGKLCKIELEVDADKEKVNWKLDGVVMAKSVITKHLKERECVAYLSCFSVHDSLKIERVERVPKQRKQSEISFSGRTKVQFVNEQKDSIIQEEAFEDSKRIYLRVSEDTTINPFRKLYDVES